MVTGKKSVWNKILAAPVSKISTFYIFLVGSIFAEYKRRVSRSLKHIYTSNIQKCMCVQTREFLKLNMLGYKYHYSFLQSVHKSWFFDQIYFKSIPEFNEFSINRLPSLFRP